VLTRRRAAGGHGMVHDRAPASAFSDGASVGAESVPSIYDNASFVGFFGLVRRLSCCRFVLSRFLAAEAGISRSTTRSSCKRPLGGGVEVADDSVWTSDYSPLIKRTKPDKNAG
jgi:hypothetical protein